MGGQADAAGARRKVLDVGEPSTRSIEPFLPEKLRAAEASVT